MTIRQTRTYAKLEVPRDMYTLVKNKLREAGYDHAFHEDSDGECIDMHGIALSIEADNGTDGDSTQGSGHTD